MALTHIANAHSIHRDARIYPDPDKFKPERFIRDGQLVGVPHADRGHFGFGWGRRVCPGFAIAERSLYIVIARCLWAFDFAYAKDAQGQDIPIDENAYTNGFSTHPLPFKCSITPRGEWVKSVVEAECSTVDLDALTS